MGEADADTTRWDDLKKETEKLQKGLKDLDERLRGPRDPKGYVGGEWPARRMQRAKWLLGPTWQKPTEAALQYLNLAEEDTRPVLEDFNQFFEKDVAGFKADVETSGLTLFPPREPLSLKPPTDGAKE